MERVLAVISLYFKNSKRLCENRHGFPYGRLVPVFSVFLFSDYFVSMLRVNAAMEWVCRYNSICNCAEEMILAEFIYAY